MRIFTLILGTAGLLLLIGTYAGKMVFTETPLISSLDLGFFLGFVFCCATGLFFLLHIKRFGEDAALFEEFDEPVFIINQRNRTLECINRATLDLFEFRREDLFRRPASHLFAGNEALIDKLFDVQSRPNTTVKQTASAMRKNGSLVTMQLSVRAIRYHGENCVMVNGRDMSEKNRILEEQARLAAILESNTSGLYACNREGIITNWNKAATKILGYRTKEILGKPFMTLIKEENRDTRWKWYQELLLGKLIAPHEEEAIHKNGKIAYLHMDVSPIRDLEGNVIGTSALFRDIGKNKESEKELKENSQRLQIVLQTAQLGLWDYDCTNDSFRFLSLRNREAFIDNAQGIKWNYQKIVNLIHPFDRQQSEIEFQRFLQSPLEDQLNLTVRIRTKDDVYRWARVTGQATERDENGLPAKVIGVSQDMSKEIAERQREESEKLRIKTLLAWSERTNASREDIIDFTLQKAVELSDSPLGLIGEINKQTNQLSISWFIPGVWPSRTGGLTVSKITTERFTITGSPLWTKAIHTREPVTINNPNLDVKDRDFFGKHNPIERYMTIPILEEGRVAGIVMVANKEEGYATHDVIELQLLAQGMWSHIRKIELESERKKAELEKNIILENLQEGVICVAKDHRVTYANRSICEFIGKSVEEIVGHVYNETDPNVDLLEPICVLQEAMQMKQPCHKEIVTAEGHRYEISANPICDEQGELFRVVETISALSAEDATPYFVEGTSEN